MTAFQTKTRHLRYILCPVKGEISPSFVHVQARGYLGKRENVKICVLSNKNKTDDYSPGQLPSSLLRLGNNSSTDSKKFCLRAMPLPCSKPWVQIQRKAGVTFSFACSLNFLLVEEDFWRFSVRCKSSLFVHLSVLKEKHSFYSVMWWTLS